MTEPIIFIVAIACLPLSQTSVDQFRGWFVGFNLFNIVAALFQRFALNLHRRPGLGDNIQGVFYRSGSGHVVGASVALSFALYFFVTAKQRPLCQLSAILAASLVHLVVADAKQVFVVSVLGFIILTLLKVGDLKKLVLYSILAVIICWVGYWAIFQIEV